MLPSYLSADRSNLEAVSRRRCGAVRLSDRFTICRVLGKYIFYADPEDIGLTPHLCLDGFWESWVTLAVARLILPDWRCVDVGANHGYYTVMLADAAGENGHVLAVEPNPKLAALIKLSLEVNGFQRRASVLEKAGFDTDSKRASLVVPRNRGMNATLCRKATPADDVIEIETITIDEATKEWPQVDFIKIDAEGAEAAIWRGMRETLHRNPAITVIMETNWSRYDDPAAFLREVCDAGFVLRHVDYDGGLKEVTQGQVLNDRVGEDWMLFLRRD
jgi:FkbM family methyltransferase